MTHSAHLNLKRFGYSVITPVNEQQKQKDYSIYQTAQGSQEGPVEYSPWGGGNLVQFANTSFTEHSHAAMLNKEGTLLYDDAHCNGLFVQLEMHYRPQEGEKAGKLCVLPYSVMVAADVGKDKEIRVRYDGGQYYPEHLTKQIQAAKAVKQEKTR